MKLQERYIRFVNNVRMTMSDEQMTKQSNKLCIFQKVMKLCNW